ncbi:hypothetical protein [Oceanicaulis sp. MMSF_3324]|uniref:hypothetical protein n=1 Tax=Oceanicaulis sp. MMSF_3324 TaxID=3046702 RepID=UPI00273E9E08|nr:hypothetical protein [Oceanicaulis sp. MMSF_3324]
MNDFKVLLRSSITALALSFTGASLADTPPSDDIALIERYFDRLTTVYESGSDADDVDALLSLMHPEVRYLHSRYGADLTRQSWRAAFVRNMDRGAYDDAPGLCVEIAASIAGYEHTAISYRYGREDSHGICQPDNEPGMLAVFWVEGGLIRQIEELW